MPRSKEDDKLAKRLQRAEKKEEERVKKEKRRGYNKTYKEKKKRNQEEMKRLPPTTPTKLLVPWSLSPQSLSRKHEESMKRKHAMREMTMENIMVQSENIMVLKDNLMGLNADQIADEDEYVKTLFNHQARLGSPSLSPAISIDGPPSSESRQEVRSSPDGKMPAAAASSPFHFVAPSGPVFGGNLVPAGAPPPSVGKPILLGGNLFALQAPPPAAAARVDLSAKRPTDDGKENAYGGSKRRRRY